MLDLTCPNFQILIGSSDISLHVTGYSFRHPLAEPSTPLIWTGQIELDLTVDTSLGATFFDDEVNPSIWLSGLQPIDVYFNGTWWQRFRIKPSGYRYDQITGQAIVEITDIIGILDSYQPSADAPEFKTGANNFWNDLAVRLIAKQAALMGQSVTVETPPLGIGGFYQIPRTVSGSYIKEAQKMAGERGIWMWCDKEVIKWVEYPQAPSSIVWRKSRRELLNFTRQQGLDPVKSKITVSATHEEVDTCGEVFPKTTWVFASSAVIINSSGGVGRRYQTIASRTIVDRYITDDRGLTTYDQGIVKGLRNPLIVIGGFFVYQFTESNIVGTYNPWTNQFTPYPSAFIDYTKAANPSGNVYVNTKSVIGNPMLVLFGGVLQANGSLVGDPPEVKGWKRTQLNAFGGFAFVYRYEKKVPNLSSIVSFDYNWTDQKFLLLESDVTTYENVPLDAQNASKILKRVITRSEPYAKFPDGLQYFDTGFWFRLSLSTPSLITERITTTYTYREIFRDDIIVTAGQKLYEIDEIVEFKEQIYFEIRKQGGGLTTIAVPRLVPQSKAVTKYVKECQGRWKEIKEVWQNKGRSTTTAGYLYSVNRTETPVTAIPDIIYRPAPFPVRQKPLLGAVETGYAGVSPYVNSNEFTSASTLTTKAECEQYARMLGRMKWQRYYSRELASGFGTVLTYVPFQGVHAGNGSYIRDRFGVSLNFEDGAWQFVEDCIGNKTGTIPEIPAPPIPSPPLLVSTLNIGSVPNQSFTQGIPISPITFYSAGGLAPYTYSPTTLPTGLSLSSGGVLSGTPTAIATTSVTVTVTDSLSATDTTSLDITVIAAPTPLLITSETIFSEHIYSVIGEMSFLNAIRIPAEVGGSYKVTGEMFFLGEQPDAVVGGTYKVIGEMSFLTLESRYKVIGEMSWAGAPPPTGLVAKTITYFACEEASGVRNSSHTDSFIFNWTGSGSALSTSGAVGDGIDLSTGFPPNAFVISGASDEATFSLNSASFIAYSFAFTFTSTPIFSPQNLLVNDQLRIVYDSGNIQLITVDDTFTDYTMTYSTDLSSLDPSNVTDWYLVVATVNTSTGEMSLELNNMGIETDVCPTLGNFAPWSDGLTVDYVDWVIDEIGVFNADLDTSDRNTLWNSGDFNTYTNW